MFAILAQSWNLIGGYAGYISIGHASFFGIGAYTAGLMIKNYGVNFLLAALSGGVLAGIFAALIGIPVLKLKGHYFAVISFVVSAALYEIAGNLVLIGGGEGMVLPFMKGDITFVNKSFYYVMFALLVVVMISTYAVDRSKLGIGLGAIRGDEESAEAAGINTALYKTFTFALSAFFTGIVGGVYGYMTSIIETNDVFSLKISLLPLVMTMLGGPGTIFGPILGAFSLDIISEILWSKFLMFHEGFLGVVIIIIVIFMPKGFLEFISRKRKMFSMSELMVNIKKYRI
jgi:branched-chain amino acid transport system permease protein